VGGDEGKRGEARGVILHFAYGANMSRAVMHKHAPEAEALGPATLADYRFAITADGYASVERKRADNVHGVLWRLSPRDCVRLAAWENVAGGLYRCECLPVRFAGRRRRALVYLARPRPRGRPKAGYMELVVAAALEWRLPAAYVGYLQHFLPKRPTAPGPRKLEEFGWT
jgi:hypothetical protein